MANDNTNKQTVVSAIWQDPARVFGCPFVQRGEYLENLRGGEYDERGKIRLRLYPDGSNIAVFYNGASRPEKSDVFTYLGDYVLNAGFRETLERCAELYGIELQYTAEAKERINRQKLAREVAPSLIEALRRNPDGETGRYVKGRGLRIDDHFGELTEQSIQQAAEALKLRGKTFDVEDFKALGLTDDNAKAGYNLVIPKYSNGIVSGLILRNIKANPPLKPHNGSRYWAASGVERGGYCDRLTAGDPAVIVEGEIDAITLIQAGVTNVVAMGGATMNDQAARLLKGRNITQITYVPDLEYNEQGQRKTDIVRNAINKFLTAKVDGEPVVSNLYIAELDAPSGASLNGLKVDVNDYARANGGDVLAEAVGFGVAWWAWEIETLLGQETTTPVFQAKFDEIYNRCANVYERERIKQYIETNHVEAFKQHGITREALNDRDEWNRGKDYNNRIKAAASDLTKAVEDGANPAVVGRIVDQLAEAQATNTRDEWERQLNETFDDELDAIRNQPDTLKSKWKIGNLDKNNNFIPYEQIEFWPADITVFCAPTSHGKTMILFQSVLDLLKNPDNKTYLYVSCEENKRQLLERALNVYMDIPATDDGKEKETGKYCFISGTRKKTIKAVLRGDVPPYEYKQYMGNSEHFEQLAKRVKEWVARYGKDIRPRLKLVHTEASIESIAANIYHYVEELRAEGVEVGGVFVDYMQLLTSDKKNFSRHDELKDVCTALHTCAGRLELPIIIAAQLNREVYRDGIDKVTVANIGEGADIERIAHDVYLVWQVDKTKKDKYLRKNKKGQLEWQYTEAGDRANRIFTDRVNDEDRELKKGYLYIEQLKARDGKTGGWGLLQFNGERGYIGENDTAKMAQ